MKYNSDMRTLSLISLATVCFTSDAINTGYARAIMDKKRDACQTAKAEARQTYAIDRMDPGCFCEKTDDGLWLCDVRFTHKGFINSDK